MTTLRLRGQSEQPTSTGSLTSVMPNRSCTPSRTSAARASSSAVLPPPRFVIARVCFVERPTRPPLRSRPNPLWKPACSISHAALVFTSPSGCSQRGAPSGSTSASDDGVREERARRPGVAVVVVEDHALAGPEGEHRLTDVGQGCALTLLDPQRAGQLGVPHRGTEVAEPQLEA